MTTQPEAILENNFIKQLTELGYKRIKINSVASSASATKMFKKS